MARTLASAGIAAVMLVAGSTSLPSLALAADAAAGNEVALDLGAGPGGTIDLRKIPKGTFVQGSPATELGREGDEGPRNVTLSKPFWLGKTPVTRAQFSRFVSETRHVTDAEKGQAGGFGWDAKATALLQKKDYTWRNPGFAQKEEDPVVLVTFGDASAFAAWASRKTGHRVRLPTEAEWEYAARGGTTTAWYGGAKEDDALAIGWFRPNAGFTTHPVGTRKANAFGLFDMSGNVYQWCRDVYAPYPAGDATDPENTTFAGADSAAEKRVLRGGSWLRDPKRGRSAARNKLAPGTRNADNGFRVAVDDDTTLLGEGGAGEGAGTPPIGSAQGALGADGGAGESAAPASSAPTTTASSPRSEGSSWVLLAAPAGSAFVVVLWVLARRKTRGVDDRDRERDLDEAPLEPARPRTPQPMRPMPTPAPMPSPTSGMPHLSDPAHPLHPLNPANLAGGATSQRLAVPTPPPGEILHPQSSPMVAHSFVSASAIATATPQEPLPPAEILDDDVDASPPEPAKSAPVEPVKSTPVEPAKSTPVEPAKSTPVEPAKSTPIAPSAPKTPSGPLPPSAPSVPRPPATPSGPPAPPRSSAPSPSPAISSVPLIPITEGSSTRDVGAPAPPSSPKTAPPLPAAASSAARGSKPPVPIAMPSEPKPTLTLPLSPSTPLAPGSGAQLPRIPEASASAPSEAKVPPSPPSGPPPPPSPSPSSSAKSAAIAPSKPQVPSTPSSSGKSIAPAPSASEVSVPRPAPSEPKATAPAEPDKKPEDKPEDKKPDEEKKPDDEKKPDEEKKAVEATKPDDKKPDEEAEKTPDGDAKKPAD